VDGCSGGFGWFLVVWLSGSGLLVVGSWCFGLYMNREMKFKYLITQHGK